MTFRKMETPAAGFIVSYEGFPTSLCIIYFILNFFQLEVELKDLSMLDNYSTT